MLTVEKLSKKYGDLLVLNRASFTAVRGNTVALIGPNGIGKTTLMKILSGEVEYDAGSVLLTENMDLAYLPQETLPSSCSLNEYFADIAEHRVQQALVMFGLSKDTSTLLSSLSSGERAKVNLIRTLLSQKDILLLDEPTNNIDIPTIILLENIISILRKIFLITSHDRRFLQETCNRVIEIVRDDHSTIARKGTYERYMKDREHEKLLHRREYERYIAERKRLLDRAFKIRTNTVDDVFPANVIRTKLFSKKSKKAHATAKSLETRANNLKKIEKPIEYEPPIFHLPDSSSDGSLYIQFQNVSVGYDSPVLSDISFDVPYGGRICFLGFNGVGKSTLVNSIQDGSLVLKGSIKSGASVRIAKLLQDDAALISSSLSIVSYFSSIYDLEVEEVKDVLSSVDIDEDYFEVSAKDLSPGQRTRCLLAGLRFSGANTIILDEPTNHLDIESVEALEFVLSHFPGTILLISHDRDFISHIKGFTLFEVAGGVKEVGSYEEYLKKVTPKFDKNMKQRIQNLFG